MSEPKDGGPAFPFKCQGPTTGPEFYYGMTLRDWFAGQALVGVLSNHDLLMRTDQESILSTRAAAAQYAYAVADSMLQQRPKDIDLESK